MSRQRARWTFPQIDSYLTFLTKIHESLQCHHTKWWSNNDNPGRSLFGLHRSNLCLQILQAAVKAVCFYFHFAFFKHLATLIETHGNNVNEFYAPAYSIAKQTIYIRFKSNGTICNQTRRQLWFRQSNRFDGNLANKKLRSTTCHVVSLYLQLIFKMRTVWHGSFNHILSLRNCAFSENLTSGS